MAESYQTVGQVSASADDAYEEGDGTFSRSLSYTIIRSYTNPYSGFYRCAGFRFTGVSLPAGTLRLALSPYIYASPFQANFKIYIDTSGSQDFFDNPHIINSGFRPRTTAYGEWVQTLTGTGWKNPDATKGDFLAAYQEAGSPSDFVVLCLANTDYSVSGGCFIRTYDYNPSYAMKLIAAYDDSLPPSVLTLNADNIGMTVARGGGAVTNDNGSSIIAHGVCWNTDGNPTIDDDFTDEGGFTGYDFRSWMSGLSPGTSYYMRAYATNAFGVGYGTSTNYFTTRSGYGEDEESTPISVGQLPRVNGLVHRYDRKSGQFNLEASVGGVMSNYVDTVDLIYKTVGAGLPSAHEPAKIEAQDGYIS